MIDPAIGSQLSDLGGFALFLLGLVVAVLGLHRGWWVPGAFYRREIARADEAEERLTRQSRSLERLTRAVKGEHDALDA